MVGGSVVRVDTRDFVGVGCGPGVGKFAATAHADKGGPGGQPVFPCKERVPRIPLFARSQRGVGGDVGDVKTAPEQLDFCLRFVIPITALPGPGVAGRGFLWDNDDAAALSLRWIRDAEFFT